MTRRATIAFGLALALIGVTLAFQLASSKPTAVSATRLQAYEGQLLPLVTEGGRTVEHGVKPAISDLRSRHVVPPAMIAAEATNWIGDLTQIRRKVAALTAEGPLQGVNAAFVRSLDRYVTACQTFRQAATARLLSNRIPLIDRGVDQAVEADRLYDRASADLQDLRRRAGLPPSSSFPTTRGQR